MSSRKLLRNNDNYPFNGQRIPATAYGERFVAAVDTSSDQRLDEQDISDETGVIVLSSRRGHWNGDPSKVDIELFLWGTADQLAAAQAIFKLQLLQDALLDRPEIYWG